MYCIEERGLQRAWTLVVATIGGGNGIRRPVTAIRICSESGTGIPARVNRESTGEEKKVPYRDHSPGEYGGQVGHTGRLIG